jgi:hypothetical protein
MQTKDINPGDRVKITVEAEVLSVTHNPKGKLGDAEWVNLTFAKHEVRYPVDAAPYDSYFTLELPVDFEGVSITAEVVS